MLRRAFLGSVLKRCLKNSFYFKLTSNRIIDLNLNCAIHTKSLQESCKYKIAVIGSGPAGFYTAQQLLKVYFSMFLFIFLNNCF